MVEQTMKIMKVVLIVSLFYLAFPQKAYAYLDPATGSYVLQIIIAALVGGLFVIKQYYSKIKGLFRKLFSRGEEVDGTEETRQ